MQTLLPNLDAHSPAAPLVVEIGQWDWNLHVGLSSDLTPKKYRFQGGLAYTRSIYIEGRVLAPAGYEGARLRLWVMPIGPELARYSEDLDNAGQVHLRRDECDQAQLDITLILPPEELPRTITSLGAIYRLVHIWTMDAETDHAWVRDFVFLPDGRSPGPVSGHFS